MSYYSHVIAEAMEQECKTNPTSQTCKNWQGLADYAPWITGFLLIVAVVVLFLPGGIKKMYPLSMFIISGTLLLNTWWQIGLPLMAVSMLIVFAPEIKSRWASVKQSTQEHKENKTMLKGLWHYLNNTRV